jgi:thiol-disulfide isomerase/thioredoxin
MKRLLPVVLLLGAAGAIVWMARNPGSARPQAAAAPDAAAPMSVPAPEPSGGPVALQFFRDPKPVPTFTARDLDGNEVDTAKLKGKVTLVNYWATWCPPCRAEIPSLIALQQKYRDQIQIIGVSEDDIPPAQVKKFTEDNHFNYPVVMNSPALEKIFTGVAALPTSFVVDRDGRLVQRHVGMLQAGYTEVELRQLAGLPVNATVEEIDPMAGMKLDLSNAQLVNIPGVDLSGLAPAVRTAVLQKLNSVQCTCGCELSVAKCRVDDSTCSVSLPMARDIVASFKSSQSN